MNDTIAWPIGILGVVQTPFSEDNRIDWESLDRLVADALDAHVDGLLVPAVASENAHLTFEEKIELATAVQQRARDNVPVFWGTGSFDLETCIHIARVAEKAGAAGCLIGVSPDLYREQERLVPFFSRVASQSNIPIMIQDWDPGGAGLRLEVAVELFEKIEPFRYLKIETVPAGPKYTAVLEATAGRLHVSGGWAVGQMIEALDRGVHAMIPECSMIRIYKKIDSLHRAGRRDEALRVFHRLLPVLAFTNQELDVSIRFFKKLLVHKGIFRTARHRLTTPEFDAYSERIAEELVDHILCLERDLDGD